jgi:Arc/MetJ family transcription regulator
MRTNIDIDDKLMKQAMKAANAPTKKATVETALRKLVQLKKQEGIRKWRGKIQWEGDLGRMREGRFFDLEQRRKEARRERVHESQSIALKAAAR